MSIGQTVSSRDDKRKQKADEKTNRPLSLALTPLRRLTLDEARNIISEAIKAFHKKKTGEFVIIAGYISRKDFLELLSEDIKLERIGGLLIIHSPASYSHEEKFAFLITLLEIYALARNLGFAMGSRLAFDVKNQGDETDPDTVEPDISLITPEDAKIFENITGPLPKLPDFIIEILSPGTREYDLTTKKHLYFNNGVKECWFVDEQEAQVHVCRKTKTSYRCRIVDEGIIRSKVVPGFWINSEWLWKRYDIELLQNALGMLLNDPSDWKALLSRLDKDKLSDVLLDMDVAVLLIQRFGDAILPLLLEHFGEAILPTVLEHFGEDLLPLALEIYGDATLGYLLDRYGTDLLPRIIEHYGKETIAKFLGDMKEEKGKDADNKGK